MSQVQEQWSAYQRGEWPVHVAEGRISRLFFYLHGGEHMFELDEGVRRSSWVRQGNDSWYRVYESEPDRQGLWGVAISECAEGPLGCEERSVPAPGATPPRNCAPIADPSLRIPS